MNAMGEVARFKRVKVEPKKKVAKPASTPVMIDPLSSLDFGKIEIPSVSVVVKTAEEIRGNLAAYETKKAEIVASVNGAVTNIRRIEAHDTKVRHMYHSVLAQNKLSLDQLFKLVEPLHRIVVVSYASAMITTCVPERNSIKATIVDLRDRKFIEMIESDANGDSVKIFDANYRLVPELIRDPEAIEAFEQISSLVTKGEEADKQLYRNAIRELNLMAGEQLTVSQILAGKEGRMVLEFSESGHFLVQVRSGKVEIIRGIGEIAETAETINQKQIYIMFFQLGAELLNIPAYVDNVRRELMATFHDWLKQGIWVAKKQEDFIRRRDQFKREVANETAALEAKATVSIAELVDKKPGFVVLQKHGSFLLHGEERPTWEVVALIEQNEAGQIRVAECPVRLKKFFASSMEFMAPRENFGGLGVVTKLIRFVANQV